MFKSVVTFKSTTYMLIHFPFKETYLFQLLSKHTLSAFGLAWVPKGGWRTLKSFSLVWHFFLCVFYWILMRSKLWFCIQSKTFDDYPSMF